MTRGLLILAAVLLTVAALTATTSCYHDQKAQGSTTAGALAACH